MGSVYFPKSLKDNIMQEVGCYRDRAKFYILTNEEINGIKNGKLRLKPGLAQDPLTDDDESSNPGNNNTKVPFIEIVSDSTLKKFGGLLSIKKGIKSSVSTGLKLSKDAYEVIFGQNGILPSYLVIKQLDKPAIESQLVEELIPNPGFKTSGMLEHQDDPYVKKLLEKLDQDKKTRKQIAEQVKNMENWIKIDSIVVDQKQTNLDCNIKLIFKFPDNTAANNEVTIYLSREQGNNILSYSSQLKQLFDDKDMEDFIRENVDYIKQTLDLKEKLLDLISQKDNSEGNTDKIDDQIEKIQNEIKLIKKNITFDKDTSKKLKYLVKSLNDINLMNFADLMISIKKNLLSERRNNRQA